METRVKLGSAKQKYQQGIWPAFWALESDFRDNYTNWPRIAEWDILEVISGGNLICTTAHCGVAPGGPCNAYDRTGNGGTAFSHSVWHIIGFMVDRSMNRTWLDETFNWYLDDVLVFTIPGSKIGDEGA